jgi:hypothetical protein
VILNTYKCSKSHIKAYHKSLKKTSIGLYFASLFFD